MTACQNKPLRRPLRLLLNKVNSEKQPSELSILVSFGDRGLGPGSKPRTSVTGRFSKIGTAVALLLAVGAICAYDPSLNALDEPTTIAGTVRDGRGIPQAGAMVELLRPDTSVVASVFTDEYGRFLLAHLVPGTSPLMRVLWPLVKIYVLLARILDWSRAQVALMRPTPSTRALEAIIRDLIKTGDGATYFAERVWGVSLRYDFGGSHPLVGRTVPDFQLGDDTRVGHLLRDGRGLLLDFATDAPLQALANRWLGRINYISRDAENRLGLSAVLVRPDGFVAWASDNAADDEGIVQAASHWFGEPF